VKGGDHSARPGPPMSLLILKRASASRPSGQWSDDDFDVLADGAVVGRILSASAPQDRLGTSSIVVEGGSHDAAAC
jgi:hypothetical protein